MKFTRIEKENYEAFAPLAFGERLEDYDIVIGAIEDGEAAGIAMFTILDEVLMLDYLYVSEKYRKRGSAKEMLGSFIEGIEAIGPAAIHTNFSENCEGMWPLLVSLGFIFFKDGAAFSVKIRDLYESPVVKKLISGKRKNKIIQLSSLTPTERKQIQRRMAEADLDPDTVANTGLCDELSLIALDEKTGDPGALILCKRLEETIVVDYLANFNKDLKHMTDLFGAIYEKAEEMGLIDGELLFVTLDDKKQEFVEKIVGDSSLLHSEGMVVSAMREMNS